MRRRRLRSYFLLILISCLATGVGLLGEIFPPTLQAELQKLATALGLSFEWFWIIALAVLTSLGLAVTFLKEWLDPPDESAETGFRGTKEEKARRKFLDDLAVRYRKRYAHKMDERHEISLLVSDEVEGTRSQQSDEEFVAGAHGTSKAAEFVIERYERLGRLLMVGSPGSGKTGLLLNLAMHLAGKARRDADKPLPVIFNLASWSPDYPGFGDWVTAMLSKGYGLSPDFAKRLHDEQRIVYLLDGLDELASNEPRARRAALRRECLTSIFKVLHLGPMSAVICCRSDEFDEMIRETGTAPPARVLTVHDLSPLRVDRALVRAGHTEEDRIAAPHLQALLGQDRAGVYYDVLSTPFFFTTALQVFDWSERPVIDASDEERLKNNLLAGFVEKKLSVVTKRRYPDARTLEWLSWLAVFLKGRVTFELSDLQPTALKRQWLYRILFSLFCGAFGGLIVTLESRKPAFGAVFAGLFCILGVYIITEDFGRWTFATLRRRRTWLISLLCGAVIAMIAGFLLLIGRWADNGLGSILPITIPVYVSGLWITSMIFAGIIAFAAAVGVRLFVGVALGMKGGVPLSKIETEDFGHWTLRSLLRPRAWRGVLQSGVEGGLAGSFVVTTCGFIFMLALVVYFLYHAASGRVLAPKLEELFAGVFLVPFIIIITGVIGFFIGFVIGILLGIPRVCRETARFVSIHSPYQRLRAGVILNILQAAMVGWAFLLLNRTPALPQFWRGSGTEVFRAALLAPSLPMTIVFGLIGLFRTPLLKHLILRVCLRLEGAMPLRYAGFLDYATELGILERDGGQWRFRHQILQDYFARLRRDSRAVANEREELEVPLAPAPSDAASTLGV